MRSILVMLVSLFCTGLSAQVDARLFRYPDVSATQISFVYGGDIWLVPKAGGTATRLTSSTGEESFPRFSPDGKSLAYTATYRGNADVYLIPVEGGMPSRLTWNAMTDRVVDWHPAGKQVLIASQREMGVGGVNQLFLLPKTGGLPEMILKVNNKPSLEGAREVVIETLTTAQERRLRNLEWIENNRKKVEQLSNGEIGYMYMPNTGGDGQTELMRQFYAQVDKKGFIIDERFNAGGQLGDRFIEMLNRPNLYNIAWRNAGVSRIPGKGNDGPKVMLINGWAGSGGDAFPWAFKTMNMGPIVGERTLGILVGPATGHTLVDGGGITVPDARLYGPDGKWFWEGIGVSPSIEVWDDPSQLAKGNDPQLLRAIEEAKKQIQANPRKLAPKPAFEDRSAKGIKE